MRLYLCIRTDSFTPSNNYSRAVVASHNEQRAYKIMVDLSDVVDWECFLIAELAESTVKMGIIMVS